MEEVFVVGGDHHNTLGVIRSLGYKGIKPYVILVTDIKNPYVASSKFIKQFTLVSNDREAVEVLKREKANNAHAVVIACSDGTSSAIDTSREDLADVFALPGSTIQGRITNLMDKSRMTAVAKTIGFTVPKSWVLSDGDRLSDVVFPCITKPILSIFGSKSDIKICSNEEDLRVLLKNGGCGKYLVQEFIEKSFEYQLIGMSVNYGEEVIIPGVSRCIRPCPGTNTGFLHFEALDGVNAPIEKSIAFIKEVGYSGLFSLEFLRGKDGEDYFLEMNFRNDGNSICVTKAGYNLPYLWYMATTGKDYKEELKKCKLHPIYVMPEFDDFRCFVMSGRISFTEWLKDLKRTEAFMEYDSQDKAPFFKGIKKIVIRKLLQSLSLKR